MLGGGLESTARVARESDLECFHTPKDSGFSGVASSLAASAPSPSPEQSSPCVLRGRERKGGKSYFSKLLSSSSLPCDSCRGREDGEGAGSGDFPECGDTNESHVWLPFLFLGLSIFSASRVSSPGRPPDGPLC